MKSTPPTLLLTLAFICSVSAEQIEIFRSSLNPTQGEYCATKFLMDSDAFAELPDSGDPYSLTIDYAKAVDIALKYALSKQQNLGKYRINKVDLISYEPDLKAYSATPHLFYRVQLVVLNSVDDGTRKWMTHDVLVCQDGTLITGIPVFDNDTANTNEQDAAANP